MFTSYFPYYDKHVIILCELFHDLSAGLVITRPGKNTKKEKGIEP